MEAIKENCSMKHTLIRLKPFLIDLDKILPYFKLSCFCRGEKVRK